MCFMLIGQKQIVNAKFSLQNKRKPVIRNFDYHHIMLSPS